jgi:hypothetical protein
VNSAIQNSEQIWHEAFFTSRRERARNMRLARMRRKDGEEYVCDEAEFERSRDAKYDRAHPRPKGNLERALPQAFDASGEWLPHLAARIPLRQSEQAHLLLENGLAGKARRQAWCGILARRLDCVENPRHKFFQRCRCFNRYCPMCGPLCFRELFAKHSRLIAVVEKLMQHQAGDHRLRVLAKLDVTAKKLHATSPRESRKRGREWRMPTRDEVREFNRDVRKLFRAIERKFRILRRDYGGLWCCEFGRMNGNLHAHALYCGPWVPQKELSRLWAAIRSDGSFIISIKRANSFAAALSHCLKYPSKFFDAPPSRLVELEVAFDRVRRVHAVAAFYNPKIEREPGEDSGLLSGSCPICGGLLGEPSSREKRGWFFADDLEREGRQDIEKLRSSVGVRVAEFEARAAVALKQSGAGPP